MVTSAGRRDPSVSQGVTIFRILFVLREVRTFSRGANLMTLDASLYLFGYTSTRILGYFYLNHSSLTCSSAARSS